MSEFKENKVLSVSETNGAEVVTFDDDLVANFVLKATLPGSKTKYYVGAVPDETKGSFAVKFFPSMRQASRHPFPTQNAAVLQCAGIT